MRTIEYFRLPAQACRVVCHSNLQQFVFNGSSQYNLGHIPDQGSEFLL